MMKRLLLWGLGAVVVAGAGLYTAYMVSPWPGALIIRSLMNKGGELASEALQSHVPTGVSEQRNRQYGAARANALDVFYPSEVNGTDRGLPTIVWIHGGGFVSGSKDHIANYLRILASKGYTTVGVDYTIAPEAKYPTPIREVNSALKYLEQNSAELHVDTTRMFLAGDSAGAQIAAQLAIIVTSPNYAQEMGIAPAMEPAQLRGVVLYCGIYDGRRVDFEGPFRSFLRTTVWSYFGTKESMGDPQLDQFSVTRNITGAFPAMFLSAGNTDPLGPESQDLALVARAQGVQVDSLFFPQGYKPRLGHEYQFNLDTEAGETALARSLEFLKGRLE